MTVERVFFKIAEITDLNLNSILEEKDLAGFPDVIIDKPRSGEENNVVVFGGRAEEDDETRSIVTFIQFRVVGERTINPHYSALQEFSKKFYQAATFGATQRKIEIVPWETGELQSGQAATVIVMLELTKQLDDEEEMCND